MKKALILLCGVALTLISCQDQREKRVPPGQTPPGQPPVQTSQAEETSTTQQQYHVEATPVPGDPDKIKIDVEPTAQDTETKTEDTNSQDETNTPEQQ